MTSLKLYLVAEGFPDSAPIAAVFASRDAALAYCVSRVVDTCDANGLPTAACNDEVETMRRRVAGTMGFEMPGTDGHRLSLSVDTLDIG